MQLNVFCCGDAKHLKKTSMPRTMAHMRQTKLNELINLSGFSSETVEILFAKSIETNAKLIRNGFDQLNGTCKHIYIAFLYT